MHASTVKKLKREAAIREVAGTMPAWQIAEMFNISVKNLQTVCVRAGISLAYAYRKYSPEEERYVVEAREAGVLIKDIARKLGRTERAIAALLYKLNKKSVTEGEDDAE